MRRWRLLLLTLVCFSTLAGCIDSADSALDPDTPEGMLAAGAEALSSGDFEAAEAIYNRLAEHAGYACSADYGLMLAAVLEVVSQLDDIAELVAPFLEGSEKLRPAQLGDLNSLIESFVQPFEASFAKINAKAKSVIADGCTLMVAGGLPIEIGSDTGLLAFEMTLGFEWDEAAARALLSLVSSLQGLLNFVLAHNFATSDNFDEAVDVVLDTWDDVSAVEPGSEEATTTTWVSLVRSAGVIFDVNPDLLAFVANTPRIDEVDNNLADALTALFLSSAEGDTGLIPAMLARSSSDSALTDNVLAWVDNGDGIAGDGDTVVIGVRALNIANVFELPDTRGGVAITLNTAFGDVETIIRNVHTIIDVLAKQMLAVEDDSIAWRRLGAQELNAILEAADVLDLAGGVPPIPEAVELDARAYFVGGGNGPKSLRDLLPYWYDDDDCNANFEVTADCLMDVFMVEAEAVTTSSEAGVSVGDTAHFPASFEFNAAGLASQTIDDVAIPADNVDPADVDSPFSFPYVAWQSPSFNGAIWIDTTALPVAPETRTAADPDDGFFRPADHYTLNKAVASFLSYYIVELELNNSLGVGN